MQNFDFKFKPKQRLSEKINKVLSKIVFNLYRNKKFQDLGLNKNALIKFNLDRKDKIREFKKPIPDDPAITPHCITVYDILDFSELVDRKWEFIKILSKFSSGPFRLDPEREINETFDRIKDSYKTQSTGNICHLNFKEKEKFNLIDGITVSYLTGEQSHIILIYNIYPSQKFTLLFKQLINEKVRDIKQIRFNSLRNIIKGKRWISSIQHKPVYPAQNLKKLIQELNYQFKNDIMSHFSIGLFKNDEIKFFPSIIIYEYDKEKTKTYLEEIFNRLRIINLDLYSDDSVHLYLPSDTSESVQIYFPKVSDSDDPFSTVQNLSIGYSYALASYWTLLNITELHKEVYVRLRKKTFKYLKRNKDSLFHSDAIKIKKEINLHFWKFERIIEDFSIKKYSFQLTNIPDLKTKPNNEKLEPKEFKEDLLKWTKHSTEDLKDSYNDISRTFKRISDDNLIKANMNLQKILLGIAILSVILTIYAANSTLINQKIKLIWNYLV